MNLNNLVWSQEIPWLDKINTLTQLKTQLEPKLTNDIPLTFDINYVFRNNWDNLSYNDQWKEVDLAIKILNLTRKWKRKYNINTYTKLPCSYFLGFFNQYIIVNSNTLSKTLGNNWNKRNKDITVKRMVYWATTLYNKKLISEEILNQFLEQLEEIGE